MRRIFQNRIVYLSVSFLLLIASSPLISIGMTDGPAFLWWLGLLSLLAGAMIPPAQRVFFPPKEKPE